MIEIFADISDDIKQKAEAAWNEAINKHNPIAAASYLSDITESYRETWTEEEIEFLQFYFQMRMEMIKQ